MASEGKDQPIQALVDGSEAPSDTPEVLKVVLTRNENQASRRAFFRGLLAGGAVALAGTGVAGCGDGEYDLQVDSQGHCRCHVVCSCDSQGQEGQSYDSQWNGNVCTCNTVCTCESVCNCESVGGDSGDSGGGGGYWYPD